MSGRSKSGNLWEAAYAAAGSMAGAAAALASFAVRRAELRERLGWVPESPPGVRPLWFHGASVGELATLKPLIAEAERLQPNLPWGVTTTTLTGRAASEKQLPLALFRGLFPFDVWPAADRFLDRIRPGALMIVETEIWPRLLCLLHEREVPVCLASARLTARSFPSYHRVRGLFRRALAGVHLIAARTEEDAQRFVELGANGRNVRVLGNTKLDGLPHAEAETRSTQDERISAWIGDRHHVVWGCLREGEETLAADVVRAPGAPAGVLWSLAPRQPADFERVARFLEREGVPYARWSRAEPPNAETRVLLVDTLGDLRAFYARADVAIVGGTFHRYGGHNLMEPALYGVPVYFGPDTSSWPEDAERLLRGHGGRRVHDAVELARELARVLDDPEARQHMGLAARSAAAAGRGASRRIIEALGERGFFQNVRAGAGA